MTLVGSYVALSKPLAAMFPVFLLAFLRFGIGALAMLGWLRKPAQEPPLRKTHKVWLFLHAFLGNFLFTICMVYGVSLTGATAAGVIMASIPACVALMSWWFLHEHISARTWLAVALAMLGIGVFALAKITPTSDPATTSAQAQNATRWLGYALLLAASLCEAAYSVIGKKLSASLQPKRITALINLWGLALSTPLGLYLAWGFDFAAVPWSMWLLLLFYALAACMWSVWLWLTGLKTVAAAQAGVFTVLLPISAAVVGVLALGEQVSAAQWLAFALAVTSVLLATVPMRARKTPG